MSLEVDGEPPMRWILLWLPLGWMVTPSLVHQLLLLHLGDGDRVLKLYQKVSTQVLGPFLISAAQMGTTPSQWGLPHYGRSAWPSLRSTLRRVSSTTSLRSTWPSLRSTSQRVSVLHHITAEYLAKFAESVFYHITAEHLAEFAEHVAESERLIPHHCGVPGQVCGARRGERLLPHHCGAPGRVAARFGH